MIFSNSQVDTKTVNGNLSTDESVINKSTLELYYPYYSNYQ